MSAASPPTNTRYRRCQTVAKGKETLVAATLQAVKDAEEALEKAKADAAAARERLQACRLQVRAARERGCGGAR